MEELIQFSRDVLQVPEIWKGLRVVSPRFIRQAHAQNIPVHVWTVDEPSDMRRLIDWGVDAIQSDRPDLLASVLTEIRSRPPGVDATRRFEMSEDQVSLVRRFQSSFESARNSFLSDAPIVVAVLEAWTLLHFSTSFALQFLSPIGLCGTL
ncbi:MAG: hypothetical protein CM1200mP14_13420 [Gammaproteobacteria bacterium]|nr:MAG: hypothetical protein CM1200mP14_13420 [Gammaproteobacteria bacterium]